MMATEIVYLAFRYKGKTYRATVEIVRTADRVAEFCRKTCIKLECCPNLFGPRMVLERCSENCSVLTKTKYSMWPFSKGLFTGNIKYPHNIYLFVNISIFLYSTSYICHFVV